MTLQLPRALAVAAALACIAMPATATAATCTGAPGTSAIEQYCEAVPSADGGRESAGEGRPGRESSASEGTNEALSEAGADGEGVRRLLGQGDGESDAPADASPSESAGGAASTPSKTDDDESVEASTPVAPPKEPSGSVLAASKSAVEGGPIAGSEILWVVLGLSLLAAAGVLFARKRAS